MSPTEEHAPAPLPYHRLVRDHFRVQEPELWRWFRGHESADALRERVRLDLLKSAFRLDREDRGAIYEVAELAAVRLGLGDPVTLYQSQAQGAGINAGLFFVPGDIHVVFEGPALERLDAEELRALLGHELTHYAFLAGDDQEYRAALSILDALNAGADAEFAHVATARNFNLYTEILCDRGAMAVCGGDPHVVIRMLVKVMTQLADVNPQSYLRQAEEIFARGPVQTQGVSHPEGYIRARALALFAERGAQAEPEIAAMIEGARRLDTLDLPGQVAVAAQTRALIAALLAAPELQAAAHLAQAHLYFDDFALDGARPWDAVCGELACDDPDLRDYFCYVLLDFVAVDREVTELALVRALSMAADLGWDPRLADLAGRELGLKKREMQALQRRAAAGRARRAAAPPPAEPLPAESLPAEPAPEPPPVEEGAPRRSPRRRRRPLRRSRRGPRGGLRKVRGRRLRRQRRPSRHGRWRA